MKQWTGSKLGKEYVKIIYHHPAYLAYMQSTSHEMPGWMKNKLESSWGGYNLSLGDPPSEGGIGVG